MTAEDMIYIKNSTNPCYLSKKQLLLLVHSFIVAGVRVLFAAATTAAVPLDIDLELVLLVHVEVRVAHEVQSVVVRAHFRGRGELQRHHSLLSQRDALDGQQTA